MNEISCTAALQVVVLAMRGTGTCTCFDGRGGTARAATCNTATGTPSPGRKATRQPASPACPLAHDPCTTSPPHLHSHPHAHACIRVVEGPGLQCSGAWARGRHHRLARSHASADTAAPDQRCFCQQMDGGSCYVRIDGNWRAALLPVFHRRHRCAVTATGALAPCAMFRDAGEHLGARDEELRLGDGQGRVQGDRDGGPSCRRSTGLSVNTQYY